MFRAVWARFSAEFWRGYAEARAQSKAKAQAPLTSDHPFFESPEFRQWISTTIKDAYDEGVQHERARIAAAWAAERDTVSRPTEPHAPESATTIH